MAHPLMPKATAVWLIESTTLTFEQIADYCGLHALEVQAIADGEVAGGMQGLNPVASGDLAQEEIERCQKNPSARLKAIKPTIPQPRARPKGARYTPVAKRQERPDAIAWLLRNYPELSDAQIARLIGTTKATIASVRERTHWNSPNIKPQNPVNLGLCTSAELEKAIAVARARARTVHARTAPGQPSGAPPIALPPGAAAPEPEPAEATAEPPPPPEPSRRMPAPTIASVFGPPKPAPAAAPEPAPASEPATEPAPSPPPDAKPS